LYVITSRGNFVNDSTKSHSFRLGTYVIFNIVGSSATFDAFLDALKAENLLKILAEPELVTTNGRPANMLAGGEFPIQVPQSLGTTTIEWREFGVRLEVMNQSGEGDSPIGVMAGQDLSTDFDAIILQINYSLLF